jgi:hypothetical protein
VRDAVHRNQNLNVVDGGTPGAVDEAPAVEQDMVLGPERTNAKPEQGKHDKSESSYSHPSIVHSEFHCCLWKMAGNS